MRNITMLETNSITGGCMCNAKKCTFDSGNSTLSECAKFCGDLCTANDKTSNSRFYTGVIIISTAAVAGLYLLSKMKGELHFNLGGINLGGINFGGGAGGNGGCGNGDVGKMGMDLGKVGFALK